MGGPTKRTHGPGSDLADRCDTRLDNPQPDSGGAGPIDRRTFLRRTGTVAALSMGGMGLACDASQEQASDPDPFDGKPHVRRYKRLGRTEMKISEISMGTGGVDSPDTVSRAYDLGINYFDTAEMYEEGRAERFIGKALKGKRDKVYLTTKALTKPETTRGEIMTALENSLRRLQTDYIDVYMCHAVNEIERLKSQEWHEFVSLAKQQGKIRFTGMSGHAGHLHACLDYAIDEDMVDVILTAHNFGTDPAFYEKFTKAFDFIANQEGLPRLFEKAKSKDIGVICMKTTMGAKLNDMRPYEWGGATFSQAAFRWVLQDPNVDALIISMRKFAHVDEYLGASTSRQVSRGDARLMRKYVELNSEKYCRNGCNICSESCPDGVPIADVLRARMYQLDYEDPTKAAESYASLGITANACSTCTHQSCLGSCPLGLNIPIMTKHAARLFEVS